MRSAAVGFVHADEAEMTKGAGFEEFYEQGGGKYLSQLPSVLLTGAAIEPEESAPHIAEFISHLGLKDSGKFQAPCKSLCHPLSAETALTLQWEQSEGLVQ